MSADPAILETREDTRPIPDRWKIAVHEAAHAVTAHALGVDVLGAFLVADDHNELAGVCWLGDRGDFEDAVISAAGLVEDALCDIFKAGEARRDTPKPGGGDKPTARADDDADAPAIEPRGFHVHVIDARLTRNITGDLAAVAAWATRGPVEKWTARGERAKSRAFEICRRNLGMLHSLSRELFLTGYLSSSTLAGLNRDASK